MRDGRQYEVVVDVTHGAAGADDRADLMRSRILRAVPGWNRTRYVAAALRDIAAELDDEKTLRVSELVRVLDATAGLLNVKYRTKLPGSYALLIGQVKQLAKDLDLEWEPPAPTEEETQ